jgi:3-(methylthio)propanoyl-CoA dehydrogenase
MPNYFTDNTDLVFHFERLDLREPLEVLESGYSNAKQHAHAPVDYRDAMDNYRKLLEVVGEIAANGIADRAAGVDESGALFSDGRVEYAPGTRKNLEQLSQADLMGIIIPHEYGGLNCPFTIYTMAIEIVARADASLVNLFGLQDIADCINKFGTDEQKREFLPEMATGAHTGAMALTEPEAGSDLQAVKLQAYQNPEGKWFLRGCKRFITNGNAQVLLVLARSEAGTKDGRGLSMFACHGGDTIKIRRIENKLGIHGSPTCELQFDDTPAELIGKRKLGLIKYVLDLMFRARMGIGGQSLGISQQAYELALKYAKERRQFGKPIYEIPVVANMLIEMRVLLESCRSLFYHSAQLVDLKEKLEQRLEQRKAAGGSISDDAARLKKIHKAANLLTPLCKLILSEAANKMSYDSLQIHGGAGYMKEFAVERLARDARITNIYEGTSQLQVVAAIGGVMTDALADFFSEKSEREYKGQLSTLAAHVRAMRELCTECVEYVAQKRDPSFQEVAARDLVELYSHPLIGYLLLDAAELEPRKVFVANRYILSALSRAHENAENLKNGAFSDVLHADKILI